MRPRRARRLVGAGAGALVLVVLVLGLSAPAGAHPLGNFTTNTSAALRIGPDEVLVDYAVDLAEIPTLQARPGIDADGDDDLSDAEQAAYATSTCDEVVRGLTLEVDGTAVDLTSADPEVAFPDGQAGLATTRVDCHLSAPAIETGEATTVHLVDANFTDKLGWREVVARGDETTITDTDVAADSASERLTSYPQERSASPPRELEATVRVVPGGPAAPDPDADASGGALPSVDRLTELVGERRLTVPFAIFALVLSFVLGGFHALAPGHGKTVMAAYLVGSEGTRRQALLLGLTVAVTHTGGVFALALVVTNSSIAPERLYPLLGTISGVLVAAIGIALFRRAVEFRRLFPTLGPDASTHHHHGIGGHSHTHTLADHTHDPVPALAGSTHDHDHGPGGHRHDHGVADHDHGAGDHDHDHGHGHGDHDRGAGDHDHGHADHDHGAGDHADHVHDATSEGAPALVATGPTHDHDHAVVGAGPAAAAGTGGASSAPATGEDQGGEDGPEIAPRMKLRNMMAMGFAGGLVPSPSALVVLLGSIAIGRAWFGLVLIIAYGAGLAAVLVGAGLLIERLRHRIEPLLARGKGPRLAALAVNLPIITSVLVVLGGAYLVVRAVAGA